MVWDIFKLSYRIKSKLYELHFCLIQILLHIMCIRLMSFIIVAAACLGLSTLKTRYLYSHWGFRLYIFLTQRGDIAITCWSHLQFFLLYYIVNTTVSKWIEKYRQYITKTFIFEWNNDHNHLVFKACRDPAEISSEATRDPEPVIEKPCSLVWHWIQMNLWPSRGFGWTHWRLFLYTVAVLPLYTPDPTLYCNEDNLCRNI